MYAQPRVTAEINTQHPQIFDGNPYSDIGLYHYDWTNYYINAIARTGGTISPSGTVQVPPGASQTFTITADTGYQISSLQVDRVDQGPRLSYTFSNFQEDHLIIAYFSPITTLQYTINATAGPGGKINPTGLVTISEGSSQTFIFTPDPGFLIASRMRAKGTGILTRKE